MGEKKKFKDYWKRVDRINSLESEMQELTDEEIIEEALELKNRAQGKEGFDKEDLNTLLVPAFALCREASVRTLEMRHFDVQLIGAMALHDKMIAEMKTGEGKTLTATLAVFLNALSGRGVHVVTVNDYLARRDAEWMMPLYNALGMEVGIIEDSLSTKERRVEYNKDIVYATNSELGFDYLRDNLATEKEEKVLRDRYFAVVDEVDNILIDEARTPLIISGMPEEAAQTYHSFAKLVKTLDGRVHKPKSKALLAKPEEEGADPDKLPDYDYEYDEKQKTAAPTEQGVHKAEKFLNIDNLYLAENGNLVNHFIQALRAESLYKKDKDYAVIDGEVHIIDEFTGRILEGRRWSEGLHQAIEAKEKLHVQEENQTIASITYQNYFRGYEKLSGMTGTALTEGVEFKKIYDLGVLEVPTNRDMIRIDNADFLYKTEEDKWRAVEEEIKERNELGQPVLVGTTSVEASEKLSKKLKKSKIPHVVLNAKPEYAREEGFVVAEAGQKKAVTIATNMAGRGVDIKLGGDAYHLAQKEVLKTDPNLEAEEKEKKIHELIEEKEKWVEKEKEEVQSLGGLYVLGTERHESRRIDNQLRGRSGRQGDPGESRFFISAEDSLIRLFAGEKISRILNTMPLENKDGVPLPLESKIFSKQIEGAQKKVEDQNFLSRKHVLEYDDVLNKQREVIYEWRDQIIDGSSQSETAVEKIEEIVPKVCSPYFQGEQEDWDLEGLKNELAMFDESLPKHVPAQNNDIIEPEDFYEDLIDEFLILYEKQENLLKDNMKTLEKGILLHIIDEKWREHLSDMDYLRQGIHLRGFAQLDPLVAYKNEGFQMFSALVDSIWEEFVRYIFHVRIEYIDNIEEEVQEKEEKERILRAQAIDSTQNGNASPIQKQVINDEKIGRNQPCPCGSGKKYKNCHGKPGSGPLPKVAKPTQPTQGKIGG